MPNSTNLNSCNFKIDYYSVLPFIEDVYNVYIIFYLTRYLYSKDYTSDYKQAFERTYGNGHMVSKLQMIYLTWLLESVKTQKVTADTLTTTTRKE